MDAYTAFVVVGPTAVAAGAVVAWLGWRGRRAGDEPTCRRCGFDLRGKPADSTHCGECGADLSSAGAVRVGHRERRWWPVVVGLLVLIVGARYAHTYTWPRVQRFDFAAAVPTRVLLMSPATTRDPGSWGGRQLYRRVRAGDVSPAVIGPVLDAALDRQGDPARRWPGASLLQAAWQADLMTAAQRERFARQSFPLRVELPRRRYRAGDAVTFRLDLTEFRGPQDVALEPLIGPDVTVRVGDGTPVTVGRAGAEHAGRWSYDYEVPPAALAGLRPGVHRVEVTCAQGVRAWGSAVSAYDATDFHPVPASVAGEFELVPADEPRVAVVTDERAAATLTAMLGAARASVRRHPHRDDVLAVSIAFGTRAAWGRVGGGGEPISLCHLVIVRDGAREWPVGMIVGRSSVKEQGYFAVVAAGPVPSGEFVDVVFRPDFGAAAGEPLIDGLVPGDVVLARVPVRTADGPSSLWDRAGDRGGPPLAPPRFPWGEASDGPALAGFARSPLWTGAELAASRRSDPRHVAFVRAARDAHAGKAVGHRTFVLTGVLLPAGRAHRWVEVTGWSDAGVIEGATVEPGAAPARGARAMAVEHAITAVRITDVDGAILSERATPTTTSRVAPAARPPLRQRLAP